MMIPNETDPLSTPEHNARHALDSDRSAAGKPDHLYLRATVSCLVLLIVMSLLLFVCAGTVAYPEGWNYLALSGLSGAGITLYLMKKDPSLLRRRMRGGPTAERQPKQKIIQLIAGIGYFGALAVPAAVRRAGWPALPLWAVIAGDAVYLAGNSLIFLVCRVNPFAASTIGIAPGQTVVSDGPYAVVRHPMYAGALLMMAAMPLTLGSLAGFLPSAVVVLAMVWRLLEEEKFLAVNLPGYGQYMRNVPHRLLPGFW